MAIIYKFYGQHYIFSMKYSNSNNYLSLWIFMFWFVYPLIFLLNWVTFKVQWKLNRIHSLYFLYPISVVLDVCCIFIIVTQEWYIIAQFFLTQYLENIAISGSIRPLNSMLLLIKYKLTTKKYLSKRYSKTINC